MQLVSVTTVIYVYTVELLPVSNVVLPLMKTMKTKCIAVNEALEPTQYGNGMTIKKLPYFLFHLG